MRFHSESKTARIARACLVLSSSTVLAACGGIGGAGASPASTVNPLPANGPQADYPVTIGAPYSVEGVQYVPADVLNYDEVGYLAAGSGEGITGAHHTLPFPSYVEVTSLETGRTILVRLEQRGPMASTHLVSLSPSAMEQLGATPDIPVRVRRVNPPEPQRSVLRSDQAAPLRMDTPMSLVQVLRRRLPAEGSASLRAEAQPETTEVIEAELAALPELPPAVEQEMPVVVEDFSVIDQLAEQADTYAEDSPATAGISQPLETFADAFSTGEDTEQPEEPETQPISEASVEVAEAASTPAPPVVEGGFLVQAAAFSTMERAERAAAALGGRVSESGRYFRVRTGPFTSRAQAEASLANVQAAGYSDARIYTAD